MHWFKQLSRRRRYDELSETIREHLDEKIADLMDEGMTREAAEQAARRQFGNVMRIEEQSREAWQWPTLEGILRDVHHAFRSLAKAPAFTLTAALTLALGIGANTAIFTLIHAVLMKSLRVRSPGELWRVGDNEQCCENGGLPDNNDWSLFSYEQYREFRDHTPGFESLAAFESENNQIAVRRVGSNHLAAPYLGEWVSGNSFDTLGLQAYAGRLLRASDDAQSAAPVAVMSFQAWEQKFGKDPSVIGASFVVNKQSVTVVGIAPPGFYGERLSTDPPSFWFPLNTLPLVQPVSSLLDHPELQWLNLIGRVGPGVNVAVIQAHMQVELRQFLNGPLSKVPANQRLLISKQYLRLSPGGAGVQRMQGTYKTDLYLLFWISGFVLLICCANLANLTLARSMTQRQQISVRAALGASQARLVQRVVVECLFLSMLGGLAGLAVAWGGAKLILYLEFQSNPVNISANPSLVVLGFAFGVSLLTGLLFSAAPAWMAAHADPIHALRGANRSTGRHTMWAQKTLVVAQAAISVVLLCSAGLLILSLNKLHHQQFGFKTAHRYILGIDPQTAGYKPQQLDALYRQLHDKLAAISGVKNVAYSLVSPMDDVEWAGVVGIEGEPLPGSQQIAFWNRVSPGYFEALGISLLEGRDFAARDDTGSRNVAIVNQTFAKKLLHGRSAMGAHFGNWDPAITGSGTYEIVGVVQDAQYWTPPTEPVQPMYYLPATQWTMLPTSNSHATDYAQFMASSHYLGSVEIETQNNFPDIERQVQRALAELNPNLTTVRFQSFAAQVNHSFSQQNLIVQLTSLFGLLALTLAVIGLYGVTAYLVTQHTSEIGIRMALGADRFATLRLILRGAFLQVITGLAIGIPLAVLTGYMMANRLFRVKPYDPTVLGLTALLLGVAALIAAFIPARRAASINPIETLRSE